MPINCKQPNVYQCGKSWTTEANEYHPLCAAYRTTSLNTVSRNIIENSGGTGRLALRRSHGTVRRRLAGGRRSIASAFLFAGSQAGDITLVFS